MAAAAAAHTDHAAARGHIDVRCVAADKTLIAAAGPPWHQGPRAPGRAAQGGRRRGELVAVGARRLGLRLRPGGRRHGPPARGDLAADRLGRSGARREARTFPDKPPRLPAGVRYVLVDMGYDSNDLGEALEYDDAGRRTGRRLVGPQQVRHNRYGPREEGVAGDPRPAAAARAPRGAAAVLRGAGSGGRLYKRRGKTVEPFFGRFKALFGLEEHVWHAGLDNNRTQVICDLCRYQCPAGEGARRGG